MIPYPVLPGDYFAEVAWWWDLEFWNKSIVRAAYLPDQFYWTPSTFPQVILHFDPKTGLANTTPSTQYVAQSYQDTRFLIAGPIVQNDTDTRNTRLIVADRPWRTEWLTSGLYDDGWTKPGVKGRIRVFAAPRQKTPVIRTVTVGVIAPDDVATRPFHARSNSITVDDVANNVDRVRRGDARVRTAPRLRRHPALDAGHIADLRRPDEHRHGAAGRPRAHTPGGRAVDPGGAGR